MHGDRLNLSNARVLGLTLQLQHSHLTRSPF